MIDDKKREEAASKYASSSWIDDEYQEKFKKLSMKVSTGS